MENVIYRRRVYEQGAKGYLSERSQDQDDDLLPRIVLTGEHNGYAIWLTLENQVHLLGFFIPRCRERAIEEAVRLSKRPVAELLKEAITQIHP